DRRSSWPAWCRRPRARCASGRAARPRPAPARARRTAGAIGGGSSVISRARRQLLFLVEARRLELRRRNARRLGGRLRAVLEERDQQLDLHLVEVVGAAARVGFDLPRLLDELAQRIDLRRGGGGGGGLRRAFTVGAAIARRLERRVARHQREIDLVLHRRQRRALPDGVAARAALGEHRARARFAIGGERLGPREQQEHRHGRSHLPLLHQLQCPRWLAVPASVPRQSFGFAGGPAGAPMVTARCVLAPLVAVPYASITSSVSLVSRESLMSPVGAPATSTYAGSSALL